MKKLLAITIVLGILMFFKITPFGQSNIKMLNTNKTKSCFSIINFDIIYKYIDSQIKKNDVAFYKYDSYELYLTDKTKISFKSNGYTLSHIIKERGIFALPKRKNDNDRILKKTNRIFCELFLSVDK